MNPQPKPKRERDEAYLKWIRTQPCRIGSTVHECQGPTEAHHVPAPGLKGMGSKVSDKRTVPVCFNAHRYCESHPNDVRQRLEDTIIYLLAKFNRLPKRVKRKLDTKPRAHIAVDRCICGRTNIKMRQGDHKILKIENRCATVRCVHRNQTFEVQI